MPPSRSEENLYAVLDAVGLHAKVGKGVLQCQGEVKMNLPAASFTLMIKTFGRGIKETRHAMYVILQSGDLGIIYKAQGGILQSIYLFDLTNPELKNIVEKKGVSDLAHALDRVPNPNWIVEKIEC